MKENKKAVQFLKIFVLFVLFGSVAYATTEPFAAFHDTFINQAKSYIIPLLSIVTIVAGGTTYMKTKDWTISLIVAAIAAALIGGAPDIATKFRDFTITQDTNTTS